jgi:hypothetical protein
VKFLHFRHAAMAVMMLVLAASGAGLAVRPRATRAALLALGLFAVVNPWVHLGLFDREARAFDRVREAAPMRPSGVGLPVDRDGRYMKASPYGHFACWIQVDRGGVVAQSFPRMFWNLPVAWKGEHFPFPPDLIWYPERFDDARLGRFFSHVLTIGKGRRLPEDFPFKLLRGLGPFQLFRRHP